MTSPAPKTEAPKVEYVGGMAVVSKLPSGRIIRVTPGDTIDDLTPEDADVLIIRPDWRVYNEES